MLAPAPARAQFRTGRDPFPLRLNPLRGDPQNRRMDARARGDVTAPVASAGDWPSPGRAWYALVILTVGLMIATIDRGILTLLVAPIKAHLGISDTQFSVLHGWAFVSVYAVLGLPIARLADRSSRRLIIGVGMAFWSVSTALCGFANSFTQFFAARAGVGAGESAYAPAVYSILQDSFPPAKLPRVFAIMAIGFAYGTSFGVILGAGLLVLAGNLAADARAGVRWGRAVADGADPGRHSGRIARIGHGDRAGAPPARPAAGRRRTTCCRCAQVFEYFMENVRTYAPMFIAMGIKAMLSFGAGVWLPEMFRRTFEWAPAKTAVHIGVIGLIVAPLGLLTGSCARGALREARSRRCQPARAADRDPRGDSDLDRVPARERSRIWRWRCGA